MNSTNQTQITLLSANQSGIDSLIEKLHGTLSKGELARESRIKPRAGKKLFVASRILLRHQLGIHLNRDPASIKFEMQTLGKPGLRDPQSIEFNLSHSKQQVALAMGTDVLGVDLEYLARKNETMKIARRYFTKQEISQLEAAENPRELFFCFWTLKEAYMKALGLGLRKGLGTFGFDLTRGINLQDAARKNEPASFFSCRLRNDYRLSLCELSAEKHRPGVFELDSHLVRRQIEPIEWL
ncbi:MAG: 4'-phosphopantetheinyl transferase superfamily protein [bacterium]